MKTTEMLMDEHKTIIKKLKELGELLIAPLVSDSITKIEMLMAFFTDFADTYHHQKEEKIYFKWMESKDENLKYGPLRCMLEEHESGRALIQQAKKAIIEFKELPNLKKESEIVGLLNQFGVMLLHHIEKEDKILYQMAEQLNEIDNDGDSMMLESFHQTNQKNNQIANEYQYVYTA